MAWRQVRQVNINEMGRVKGLCLVNTRIAASPDIPARYGDAATARRNTILHSGSAPAGVWTPLFFTFFTTIEGVYKDWGHVGWQSPDGKFYSDGDRYDNVEAYMRTHFPRYVGWGETLNGVRVVEWVADPTPPPVSQPGGRTVLHLNKGTISTLYLLNGKTGSIYARDDTYDYTIREDQGYRVKIRSASGGGEGWIYLIYQTGSQKGRVIPGRYTK